MNERDAFLQSVLAAPDDDGPRLICADWLEERGDARGEFIRIQCELASMPPDRRCRKGPGECGPRSKCWECALRRRERELLAKHRGEWMTPLVDLVPEVLCDRGDRGDRGDASHLRLELQRALADTALFRRGFVERVELPPSWYALIADRLHAATPLQELVLPGAQHIRAEAIRDACSGRGLRRLFLRYPLNFSRLTIGKVWLAGVRSELPDVKVTAIGTKESPDDA